MQFTTQKSSRLGIGIDFGTSNSAAAVFDGERVTLVKLAAPASVMPSANYIDQQVVSKLYRPDLRSEDYISGNRGRKVELSAQLLGGGSHRAPAAEKAQWVAQAKGTRLMSMVRHSTIPDLPGRLFRGTKRLLGNTTIDRTASF